MKSCPYCAEEIQDAAIVCRYCGKDIQITHNETNNPVYPILKFILHPMVVIFGLMMIVTQSDLSFGNTGALGVCGLMLVVIVVTTIIRDKVMTDEEKKHEQDNAEYWSGRGR